eukprot:8341413-Alexandrium_andersonii.AAC.1
MAPVFRAEPHCQRQKMPGLGRLGLEPAELARPQHLHGRPVDPRGLPGALLRVEGLDALAQADEVLQQPGLRVLH